MPMESIKVSNDDGFMSEVKISNDVIATIAALAAVEVEGVYAVAGTETEDVIKRLGLKSNKNLEISFDTEHNLVSIKMSLTMRYGYSIPETCEKVQDKIKSAVESMVGITVSDVSINISDVSSPEK